MIYCFNYLNLIPVGYSPNQPLNKQLESFLKYLAYVISIYEPQYSVLNLVLFFFLKKEDVSYFLYMQDFHFISCGAIWCATGLIKCSKQ